MARYLKANFISEALKWKADPRHANDLYFAGLRYEPFIFHQARLTFPAYDKRFPVPDNRGFTENFAKDLRNPVRNRELLKIINPDSVTPEIEAANTQFQAAAQAEQQALAQTTGQPVGQPFSLTPAMPTVAMPAVPRIVINPPVTPIGGKEGGTGLGTAATNKSVPAAETPTVSQPPISTPNPPRTVSQPSQVKSAADFQNKPASINFSAVRSRIGGGIFKAAQAGLETANPFLKRAGNGLVNGLMGIANPGGFGGGGGTGSRSILGRFTGGGTRGRFGGIVRRGESSIGKAQSKRLLLFFFGIILFGALVGLIASSSSPTTPVPTGPIPVTTNISQCKFSRAGVSTQFQSSALLGYIQEASQKSTIPPTVLAAFIRVESPSSSDMSNDQIANYANNCAESPTGALGIMQIQPPGTTSLRGDPASCDDCIDAGAKLVGKTVSTLTRQDYCDPRTSIIVGAGWILKKMSKLSYGDGTKWDPIWTNNSDAIKALVNTYYGCLDYGGATDCTGPYNYATDVLTSIQGCQAQSVPSAGTTSCPINGGYVSTPSYSANPGTGHCGGGYAYSCHCGTEGRRAKAIDVPTNGQSVVLPTINGQSVNWTLVTGPYSVDSGEGGGFGYTFQAIAGADIWYLDMLHLNQSALKSVLAGGESYPSGTPVATTVIDHVHMTIGKNLSSVPIAGSATDCDPNWLPSDFMCQ